MSEFGIFLNKNNSAYIKCMSGILEKDYSLGQSLNIIIKCMHLNDQTLTFTTLFVRLDNFNKKGGI